MARSEIWTPRGKILNALSNGRMSRSALHNKTRLTAKVIDVTLDELANEGLVRVTKDAGQRGAPTTWIELVR